MLIKMFRLGRLVRLIRLVRHRMFYELKACHRKRMTPKHYVL